MKRIFKIFALCALVVAAASCSKSRAEQMKLAENVKVSCTPEVLALVGDKIPAEITVTYPAKYFHPKATLEVTPVLVYEGGEQPIRERKSRTTTPWLPMTEALSRRACLSSM